MIYLRKKRTKNLFKKLKYKEYFIKKIRRTCYFVNNNSIKKIKKIYIREEVIII